MASVRHVVGTTALVVTVPEAEPVVHEWRQRHDPSSATGMPAHVTVLYPWLDERTIDDGVDEALAGVVAAEPAFDLRLGEIGRFAGTLYLRPDPAEPFRRLTATLAGAWPDHPPYGGAYDDVVPHLTVADGEAEDVLDGVEAALDGFSPITARITSVDRWTFDGRRWVRRHTHPLRAS